MLTQRAAYSLHKPVPQASVSLGNWNWSRVLLFFMFMATQSIISLHDLLAARAVTAGSEGVTK